MMLLSVVIGILLIGLIVVGQKLAQKMAVKHKTAALGAVASAAPPAQPDAERVPVARHYQSDKVGNDAAARPWDHGATSTASTPSAVSGWEQTKVSTLSFRPDQLPDRVPANCDLSLLIERSKEAFMRLQNAWEHADTTALRDLLVPTIWQGVEDAIQKQNLPDWGQRVGDVQHLTARVLAAELCDDDGVRARLEFTGSQWYAADEQVRPIHEVWDIRYREQPLQWQIADLQAG
jgi:predicted lipid-binding transport protein (Tim44 family)